MYMYTARVQGSELIKASSARKCILNLWIWQSDLLAGWGKQKEFTSIVTMEAPGHSQNLWDHDVGICPCAFLCLVPPLHSTQITFLDPRVLYIILVMH